MDTQIFRARKPNDASLQDRGSALRRVTGMRLAYGGMCSAVTDRTTSNHSHVEEDTSRITKPDERSGKKSIGAETVRRRGTQCQSLRLGKIPSFDRNNLGFPATQAAMIWRMIGPKIKVSQALYCNHTTVRRSIFWSLHRPDLRVRLGREVYSEESPF